MFFQSLKNVPSSFHLSEKLPLTREEGLESQTAEGAFNFCTELCSVGSTGLAPSSSYSDTCRAASREVAPTIATLLGFTPERLPMGFTVPGGTVVTLSYHTNARGTRWSPFLTRHGGCHPPQLYLCLCVHLAKRRGHLGTLWLTWLPGLVSLFKRIRAA